jgi:hypothetical protein
MTVSTPNAQGAGHDWVFSAASTSGRDGSDAVVIAICTLCGTTRATAARPGEETKLDLGGECEARPSRTVRSFSQSA